MSIQVHQSDPRILNRRSVERDHKHLLHWLRPGMSVLDVGCGTGSITAGIARLVGPHGEVTGVDRDQSLLEIARQAHGAIPNLQFATADVLHLDYTQRFDIVTTARVLQWISDPAAAILRMKAAAKPGGKLIALDYNHEDHLWEPTPPEAFLQFFTAFLDWRRQNGWENQMGARLPALFQSAGLEVAEIANEDELCERGAGDFAPSASIWSGVIETLGPTMVAAGAITEPARQHAAESYRVYTSASLSRQTLRLRAVTGTVR